MQLIIDWNLSLNFDQFVFENAIEYSNGAVLKNFKDLRHL